MAVCFHIQMDIISKEKDILSKIAEKHFKNGTFELASLDKPKDFEADNDNLGYWWGTPDECFDGTWSEPRSDSHSDSYLLESDFYTVWGIPIVPFTVLSTMYPDCRFEIFYNADCDIDVDGNLALVDGKCV